MPAQPEQLQAVGVDTEPTLALDLANSTGQPAVVDLGRPAAARADDVVVVSRRARNIGVGTTRQVQPLHDAEFDEELEDPEQCRPADTQSSFAGRGRQLEDGEMAIVTDDQLGDGPPRCGEAIATALQGAHDRVAGVHGLSIAADA